MLLKVRHNILVSKCSFESLLLRMRNLCPKETLDHPRDQRLFPVSATSFFKCIQMADEVFL